MDVDRYVIVGCHYDSWSYGAMGPSSGTAVLFELMTTFNHLVTYTGNLWFVNFCKSFKIV